MNGEPAIDLVHRLLGRQAFGVAEEPLDLLADVDREILAGNPRWRRVSDSLNVDLVEIPAAGMKLAYTAGTEEWTVLGIGFRRHRDNR
jgi:hypothetical protein